MLSSSNARLVAARRLTRRSGRRDAGRFLVEGAQAVREALAAAGVVELFATADAITRHPQLTAGAAEISDRDAASLSETTTPQGLVAVCRDVAVPLADALRAASRVITGLVDIADPGNAGTILRTADAAGAGAVVFCGTSVDPYNGKAVRATAGSLFHVDVVTGVAPLELIDAARAGGYRVLATTGIGATDLYDVDLSGPVLWLFGNEAHGLPDDVIAAADETVRVPIHGRAESLNLAAAAAVCLYASAQAPTLRP